MALPPLAPVSSLAAWLGQTIESADPRAGAVLSAASALVRAYTGQTWVDATNALTDVPDVVSAVVVQVAARVWTNPAGLTSVTIDDATRRWGDSGTAGLFLTEQDKGSLADYALGGQAELGTISFERGGVATDTVYVPTGPPPSGYPFPWYSGSDLP